MSSLHFIKICDKIDVVIKNLLFQGGEMMRKSTNDMYFDNMYLLEKIRILLDYISKISARFLLPSIGLSKIAYICQIVD